MNILKLPEHVCNQVDSRTVVAVLAAVALTGAGAGAVYVASKHPVVEQAYEDVGNWVFEDGIGIDTRQVPGGIEIVYPEESTAAEGTDPGTPEATDDTGNTDDEGLYICSDGPAEAVGSSLEVTICPDAGAIIPDVEQGLVGELAEDIASWSLSRS